MLCLFLLFFQSFCLSFFLYVSSECVLVSCLKLVFHWFCFCFCVALSLFSFCLYSLASIVIVVSSSCVSVLCLLLVSALYVISCLPMWLCYC